MSKLASQLNLVIEKTKTLVELCEALKEENDLLKLENQSLTVALDTGNDKNKRLEEKVKALTVAKSLDEAGVASEQKQALEEKVLGTKQKIDEFVREIDKCISLLK